MQKITARLLLLAAMCCALNSCGTKGALYIPEQKYPPTAPAGKLN